MAKSPQKPRGVYVCNACGAAQPKWSGQCPDCGAWNSLEEVTAPPSGPARPGGRSTGFAGAAGQAEAEIQNCYAGKSSAQDAVANVEKIVKHAVGI